MLCFAITLIVADICSNSNIHIWLSQLYVELTEKVCEKAISYIPTYHPRGGYRGGSLCAEEPPLWKNTLQAKQGRI